MLEKYRLVALIGYCTTMMMGSKVGPAKQPKWVTSFELNIGAGELSRLVSN